MMCYSYSYVIVFVFGLVVVLLFLFGVDKLIRCWQVVWNLVEKNIAENKFIWCAFRVDNLVVVVCVFFICCKE